MTRLLAFFILMGAVAQAQESCVLPTASNIGFISLICSYEGNSELTGQQEDATFYENIAGKLSDAVSGEIKPYNPCESSKTDTKDVVLRRLEKYLNDKEFMVLNASGHGVIVPGRERGEPYEWAYVLGSITSTPNDCMDLFGQLESASKDGVYAQKENLGPKYLSLFDKFKDAGCEDYFVRASDLKQVQGKRPMLSMLDACFSGGAHDTFRGGDVPAVVQTSSSANDYTYENSTEAPEDIPSVKPHWEAYNGATDALVAELNRLKDIKVEDEKISFDEVMENLQTYRDIKDTDVMGIVFTENKIIPWVEARDSKAADKFKELMDGFRKSSNAYNDAMGEYMAESQSGTGFLTLTKKKLLEPESLRESGVKTIGDFYSYNGENAEQTGVSSVQSCGSSFFSLPFGKQAEASNLPEPKELINTSGEAH